MSTEAVLAVLSELLPSAAAGTLDTLGREGTIRHFVRGDRLEDHDGTPHLVVLLAGYAGSWRSDADGQEQLVALYGPGEAATLLSLADCGPPPDLRALTAGSHAAWPGDSVMRLARSDPGVAIGLLDLTLHSTSRLMTRLEHLAFDPVSRRLARLLWQRRDILFDARRPLLSRVQLANLVGATREMTDRVLRDFERDGIVRRIPPTGLVLVDPQRLSAIADLEPDAPLCS